MRHLLSGIFCMLLLSSPVQADDLTEIRELLKTKIDAVVLLLQDKTLNKTVRNEQIIDIVTPIFDYQTMAKLSLGKKHWPQLNQEQREEFSELFTARLQESYLDKLDIYSDEEVVFGEPKATGKTVQLPTTLISKGNRIGMLYKFYRPADSWMIYDVEIGGVSIIQTYRSQFDEALSKGPIDDLLVKLKADGGFVLPGPDSTKGQSEQM